MCVGLWSLPSHLTCPMRMCRPTRTTGVGELTDLSRRSRTRQTAHELEPSHSHWCSHHTLHLLRGNHFPAPPALSPSRCSIPVSHVHLTHHIVAPPSIAGSTNTAHELRKSQPGVDPFTASPQSTGAARRALTALKSSECDTSCISNSDGILHGVSTKNK